MLIVLAVVVAVVMRMNGIERCAIVAFEIFC